MMVVLAVLCALALLAGFLLMRRLPLCPHSGEASAINASVIVPARNEEATLPKLLGSLKDAGVSSVEVAVIDDHSTDQTANVAKEFGATVVPSAPLPPGWTGKTWACAQGAQRASGSLLLFLDADTWFEPHGLERLLAAYPRHPSKPVALSLLPYHVTRAPYEELSLFFNLLMAFGAGGFGVLGTPRLFGQSLLIDRDLYAASGGHEVVHGKILENFALANRIEAAGGHCACLGGRGVLHLRMFPEGLHQLRSSWKKAFADGAAASDGRVLGVAVAWLTALCTAFLLALATTGPTRLASAALYVFAAMQVGWFARQIGTFRWYTAALYPIPLLFFFVVFTDSLLSRVFRRQVTWKGRQL